ncbi:MAG: molybdopterin molybdotransferase MoeA [Bacteroidota bacterium]
MIHVDEALKLVLDSSSELGIEVVNLSDAIGRFLAEDIYADRPIPPFDRVTMDGIAILHASYKDRTTPFRIEAIGPAGSPQLTLMKPENCIEIMTGASLPKGTDTIIRYEDLERVEDTFYIQSEISQGQNVHHKGSDHEEGVILLHRGLEIKAIDVNILASVGKTKISVLKMPKVAVISSGDELVEVDQVPKDYQVRKSNVYMISARLRQLNLPSQTFHFKDDEEGILNEVERVLEEFDVLLMSGGVSKGKFDFIPAILEKLGFEKLFHRVAQRPGKPFWFGKKGKKTVFAFPGNPVSTLACFHKYFIPWLHKTLGKDQPQLNVVLSEDVSFKPNLTYFAQAMVAQGEDGRYFAKVRHGKGSGDIVSPSMMNGFVELPQGPELYKAGEMYRFMPFYPLFK